MRRLRLRLVLGLVFLSSIAAGEWIPAPTLKDLLGADCAAVGHFVREGGVVRFVAAKVLWGDVSLVERLRKGEDFAVTVEDDGRLSASTWGNATPVVSGSGIGYEDAGQTAVWLFDKDEPGLIIAEPVEMAEGLMALRRNQTPSLLFRLLQRVDFDVRRYAMEELVADRDADTLAELHRIALSTDSLGCLNAVEVLKEAGLLDLDRFWDVWTRYPCIEEIYELLKQRDGKRAARSLGAAIEAEKRGPQVADLLYLAHDDVELNIRHLDHAVAEVRHRALGNLYGILWSLACDPDQAARLEALAKRLLPLLVARRKLETSPEVQRYLDQMLKEEDGVPWILRVPAATATRRYRYSEEEEKKFVIGCLLTSGRDGFPMDSAGREVAGQFPKEGFDRLKDAASRVNDVYDGMGYVRHPAVFAYLVERAQEKGTPATIYRAIGRQNAPRSFDVLKEILETRHPEGSDLRCMLDGLALVRDERALGLLKGMGTTDQGNAIPYLRACAAHGDETAIRELLDWPRERSRDPDLPFPSEYDKVIDALLLVDSAEATDAIREYVRDSWPARWERFLEGWFGVTWCLDMENYAGGSRRTTALGEVARRDPRWLAGLALERMASPSLTARLCGAYIFERLTGRSFGFRAEAFAAERAGPLRAATEWWKEHEAETREQWVLSAFRERGFPVTRFDKSALPVLVDALAADPLTHDLAVERISVITGKYFADPTIGLTGRSLSAGVGVQRDQESTTIRAIGWLKARKLLPEAR